LVDGRVPRWPALLREALAVLAAILVAFALDAWWEERQERRMMLEALDAVAIEIERNVALLDSTLALNEGQAALVQRAISLDSPTIQAMGAPELARYADLPNYTLATLELGAVTAFIEGGFLATLQDRGLRAELAGLPRLQAELDEEAQVVTSASQRVNALSVESVPVEELRRGVSLVSPASTRAMLEAFATDQTAVRALAARTFFLTYLYSGEVRRTRERLAEVARGIERFRGEG
jgi:hypothetical protein